MQKTGIAELPLHYGKAPPWLINKMKKLAKGIVTIIIDEYGQSEFLRRISNPFFFQSLGCLLGYDWHSSGVTTVLTSVLKEALNADLHRLIVAGGKGRMSLHTLDEIERAGRHFGFSWEDIERLKYASRMTTKVDNCAIQSGYELYHHAFFLSEDGEWAVVQQGMCLKDGTARRYHWLSSHVRSFVEEPHDAIVCDVKRELSLDMTAKESEDCRKMCTDLVKEGVRRVKRDLLSIRPAYQTTLAKWIKEVEDKSYVIEVLRMPKNVNWKALKRAYEVQPCNYEELLSIRGIGPATVRALALISEIIYGSTPSWKDPVKYSFAFGGKDSVPRPVDRKAMDEAIQFLEALLEKSKLEESDKLSALKRLRLKKLDESLD